MRDATRPNRPALFTPMLKTALVLCLLCALCAAAFGRDGVSPAGAAAAGGPGAQESLKITVEEAPLTGPFSMPQMRGGRLFLPLVSIARALGDAAQVDAAVRAVRVLRQTGVRADFEPALNVVRENGAVVLVLSGAADLDFPPQPEALMLPVEIVSALLDVAIHIDTAAGVVSVRRGKAASSPVSRAKRDGPLEIFDAEYDYGLDSYPAGFNHNLTLRADGRLFDGRFFFTGNVAGATGDGLASFNTGGFSFERPNGQRLKVGDVGVAGDLTFMSSMVRGGWAQISVGGARVSGFAGRAAGGLVEPAEFERPVSQATPEPDAGAPRRRRRIYDTRVAGAYLTFGGPGAGPRRSAAWQFSSGVMSFDGESRRGRLMTGGLRASSARFGLQADFGVGSFSGLQQDGVRVEGGGAAADVSGSLNLRDNLTVQGHYTFNSKSFMAAQAGGPASLNLKSFGVTWSPRRWLTASVSDTASSRPNVRDSRERFTTATFNVTPARYLSNVFFSHTQYRTAQVSGGSYTLLNASKTLSRWYLFANVSRIKGSGDTYRHAQVGARVRLRESDSLQVSQTFGGGGTLAGTADWMTQSLLSKRVSLGAGLGYGRSASSPLSVYERLNASVSLPFKQTLQVTYGHLQSGPQLHLSLRGPLFFRRRAHAEADLAAAELSRRGRVTGRVYQDLNFNGRYDAGADSPQANVRVRVDGNLSVLTDAEGVYRIENAQAGEHTVALDLLSVRADLTILGEDAQTVSLGGGFESVVDFRTARTGRVAGVVWLDTDGDGLRDEGEQPLADVRVVTSTGRDTLTNEDGQFVVGDLAPGAHVIVVDVKTLPEESVVRAYVAAAQGAKEAGGSLQVLVAAGAETGDVRFAVSPRPPERKQF
ncbi:MAG TPA: hypothetical protein VF668_00530 [Pyrinomonadaceae bacterium]